jgi:hypothetical protein
MLCYIRYSFILIPILILSLSNGLCATANMGIPAYSASRTLRSAAEQSCSETTLDNMSRKVCEAPLLASAPLMSNCLEKMINCQTAVQYSLAMNVLAALMLASILTDVIRWNTCGCCSFVIAAGAAAWRAVCSDYGIERRMEAQRSSLSSDAGCCERVH